MISLQNSRILDNVLTLTVLMGWYRCAGLSGSLLFSWPEDPFPTLPVSVNADWNFAC